MVTTLNTLSPGGLPQVALPTGHTAVHLTTYSDVQKILTDTSFIRSDTNVDDGPSFLPTVMPDEMFLNLDHPHHGRLKRFVAAAYSANTMSAFAPTVRGITSDAVSNLATERSFDLITDLLDPLTIAINATYLGIPDRDIPSFRHLSRQMQLAHNTDIPQLLEDFWELYHYLEDLIAEKRPLEKGLIKDLLAAREDATPPVSDGEYAALLLGSLVGGDQNVLSVLAKIAFVALAHHELWDLMVADPDSIPTVTEELLRLLPLGRISTFPRIASRDVEVSGGTLLTGETVYADAHAANRDPAVFADP
jgi:cytochrome P450